MATAQATRQGGQAAPDPSQRRLVAAAALVWLLLCLALLALYWWPESKRLAGDEQNYQQTALAILAGGDWFDRHLVWPPLQGLFMAAVYTIAGPHLLAVQLVQLGLLAASGVMLARIVTLLTGHRRAATWAGILLAVNPLTIAFATWLWPEIIHLAASLLLALCLVRLWRHGDGRHRQPGLDSLGWVAGAGLALGLCLLAKSLLTAFWPLLLLALVSWHRREGVAAIRAEVDPDAVDDVAAATAAPDHHQSWRAWLAGLADWRPQWPASGLRLAVFALAAILVCAPALVRGWQETGRPMIADSSWFNLWTGLADRWRGDFVFDETGHRFSAYLASGETHDQRVAFARQQAAALVEQQGLAATVAGQLGKQYFRLFDARNSLVAQLPGEPCRGYLSTYRLASPHLVGAIDLIARGWHLALLGLAAFGLALWRQWRAPWLWLLAAFAGYQMALFAVLHVKTRFLLPLLPLLCLFAGHALAGRHRARDHGRDAGSGANASGHAAKTVTAAEPVSSPARPGPLHLRLALGAVLTAMLWFLASAGPWFDQACAASADAVASTGPPLTDWRPAHPAP
ncbi:MAG: glycosyltransferase family 39 protein [Xanthomonadales bacterium]|nr:glycosyltransferase family 39 protein [Xanthomonadales bacterium]